MRDKDRRDGTKPDGQPGRMMDASRAEKKIGGRAKIKFEEGVEDFGHELPGEDEQLKGRRFFLHYI